MELLQWLQNWYLSMCDGDWEHYYYNVSIGTLDNPGWYVRINLVDTPLEEKIFEEINDVTKESDWIVCRVKDGNFDGAGDPLKLISILQIFKDWAES